jgi:oligoendopeptidase F
MAEAVALTGAEDVRWDLSDLYSSPTDPALERDLAAALEFARDFEQQYRGRIAGLEPAEFAAMMKELAEHYQNSVMPGLYAHLLHSQNTQDAAAGRLVARSREAAAEQGKHLVFFSLEVAQLSDEQAQRLYAHPEAAAYRHTVEQERRYRPHQLSEVEEKLLTEISPVGRGAWTRLIEELCAAIQVDLDGGRLPLSQALARLREPDREVRRAAVEGVTQALNQDIRTRAYIFNVVLQDKSISDRMRHYPSWISSRNLANETSDEAVEALVAAVTRRYGMVARYYRAKRKLLGYERLYLWDRYAPIEEFSRRVSWDEAKDLVVGSYERFSTEAGRLVAEFFERSWIDAPVAPNKEGGAYCAGAGPHLHPFVMMNFTGQLNDALTLAHELGHGLHDRLASGQHIFDYHPPLTLAETASVFGEALTFDRIMSDEKDPQIRLSMLCHQLEDAFATIFRQVAFNRFEHAAHTVRREEGELSGEQLGELWQAELTRMFGDSLDLTDGHKAWWSYVEHFIHTPGYVYAYAFGNLLALSLYQRYKNAGPGFVDSYLAFLAAGGSQAPDELVRTVGMDITDPGFWEAGLDILERMVEEVERLAG